MEGKVCHEDSPCLSCPFKLEFKIQDTGEVLLDSGHRPVACTQAPAVISVPKRRRINSQRACVSVGSGPGDPEVFGLVKT